MLGVKRRLVIMRQRINELFKYPTVVLKSDDGKSYSHFVHRLVAEHFIPNPDNKPCIDHIDTDRTNNNAKNLRWVTHSENLYNPITHAKRVGMKYNAVAHNRRAVVQIKEDKIIRIFSFIEETKLFGFLPNGVCRCCRGIISHHKGYQWKYLSDCPNLNISDVKELLDKGGE